MKLSLCSSRIVRELWPSASSSTPVTRTAIVLATRTGAISPFRAWAGIHATPERRGAFGHPAQAEACIGGGGVGSPVVGDLDDERSLFARTRTRALHRHLS